MEFAEIQKLVIANNERYSKKHEIEIDLDWLLLKLIEENGEFANALLIYKNKCREEKKVSKEKAAADLGKELADVFTTVLLIASKLNINLLETLNDDVLRKGKRYLDSLEQQ